MDDFSLMSVNLRFGRAQDGPDSWENRKHLLARFLELHPADFVCVQEANDFQADFLSSLLPGHAALGQRENAPAFWQDNIIFHSRRFFLDSWDRFHLSHVPDLVSRFAESKWPRQCTLGRFTLGGRSLVVGDTHLDFTEAVREASARLILSRLARLPVSDPVVLAGDFNAPPGSSCYNLFVSTAPEAGGAPPFSDPFDESFGPTHHRFTGTPDPKTGRIDWILYRGPVTCTRREILHDSFEGRYPSDHFPVYAEFVFSQEGGRKEEG
ncbi:MAG: endonuclease/exonuclease/phosphatase family protein [Proteobacteria bacterium]|nr:endonuclease/exonuclease/phosphatase family protein [Pseudomonadota bacterium]